MLSVSAQEYFVPVKVVKGDDMCWSLHRRDSEEYTATRRFNYTIFGDEGGKMTFTYDENSVKPSPRTLRIYGPMGNLGKVVSALSRNTEDNRIAGGFINEVLKQEDED